MMVDPILVVSQPPRAPAPGDVCDARSDASSFATLLASLDSGMPAENVDAAVGTDLVECPPTAASVTTEKPGLEVPVPPSVIVLLPAPMAPQPVAGLAVPIGVPAGKRTAEPERDKDPEGEPTSPKTLETRPIAVDIALPYSGVPSHLPVDPASKPVSDRGRKVPTIMGIDRVAAEIVQAPIERSQIAQIALHIGQGNAAHAEATRLPASLGMGAAFELILDKLHTTPAPTERQPLVVSAHMVGLGSISLDVARGDDLVSVSVVPPNGESHAAIVDAQHRLQVDASWPGAPAIRLSVQEPPTRERRAPPRHTKLARPEEADAISEPGTVGRFA